MSICGYVVERHQMATSMNTEILFVYLFIYYFRQGGLRSVSAFSLMVKSGRQ